MVINCGYRKLNSEDDLDKIKREIDDKEPFFVVIENKDGSGYIEIDLAETDYRLTKEAVQKIKNKINNYFYKSNNVKEDNNSIKK